MKKLLVVVSAVCFLASCNSTSQTSSETPAETITLSQSVGEAVVPVNPKRVVALDYSSLENLDYLNIPVVGFVGSHLPSYLTKYASDETVQDLGTMFEVNYEKLVDLNPDVIFISARMEKIYPELSKIAPTVYLDVDQTNAKASFEKNFTLFGQIFQKEAEVKAALDSLNAEIDALKAKADISSNTGLIILHNNGKMSAFGPGSRFGIIHDLFGVKPAVADLEVARHGQPVSSEFIKKANPSYLYLVDRSAVVNKDAAETSAVFENALIQETEAFKKGQVVMLNPEAWYLSGDGIISFKKVIADIAASIQ